MRRGFSLIEILVVVATIGILSLILFLSFSGNLGKSRDAKRKSDIAQLQRALQSYESDFQCYPTSVPNCGETTNGSELEGYISSLPCDPKTGQGYAYQSDPDTQSCPRWYKVFANLENTSDPEIDKLGCSGGCGPSGENYYAGSPNAPQP